MTVDTCTQAINAYSETVNLAISLLRTLACITFGECFFFGVTLVPIRNRIEHPASVLLLVDCVAFDGTNAP